MTDKYNVAVVRGHCCQFLATHVSEMDLAHPLDSPRNVLRGASLAHVYGSSKAQDMVPYSEACMKAVDGALAKLVGTHYACTGCSAYSSSSAICPKCHYACSPMFFPADKAQAARLLALVKDARYPTLVVHEVQVGTLHCTKCKGRCYQLSAE